VQRGETMLTVDFPQKCRCSSKSSRPLVIRLPETLVPREIVSALEIRGGESEDPAVDGAGEDAGAGDRGGA